MWKYTEVGAKFDEGKPREAAKLLRAAFGQNEFNVYKTAEYLDVHVCTVKGWLRKLKALGVPDPRGANRARNAPRGPNKLTRAEREKIRKEKGLPPLGKTGIPRIYIEVPLESDEDEKPRKARLRVSREQWGGKT
jgi:hypothetical protein